jgi:ketosteroid isomerase-like protein
MIRRLAILGLLLAGVALGCQTRVEGVVDEVIQADVDFDRAMADGDLERFAEMVAHDAVFFGGGITEGRDAVARDWAPFFEPDAPVTLRWRPVHGEVASSGDLGYTWGEFKRTVRDGEGSEAVFTGSYVTVWRRGDDSRWRAVLDIGTPPEPIERNHGVNEDSGVSSPDHSS